MRLLVPPGGAAGGVLLQLVAVFGLVPNNAFAVLTVLENGATPVCWVAVAVAASVTSSVA